MHSIFMDAKWVHIKIYQGTNVCQVWCLISHTYSIFLFWGINCFKSISSYAEATDATKFWVCTIPMATFSSYFHRFPVLFTLSCDLHNDGFPLSYDSWPLTVNLSHGQIS